MLQSCLEGEKEKSSGCRRKQEAERSNRKISTQSSCRWRSAFYSPQAAEAYVTVLRKIKALFLIGIGRRIDSAIVNVMIVTITKRIKYREVSLREFATSGDV